MSQLFFETDAAEACPIAFGGPSDVLVHFQSLAFSTRYGSIHPLSQLALLLRGEMKIDLGPLTTFADRNAEVEADEQELERVWQEAGPLADSLADLTRALESPDERLGLLTEESPDLLARLCDLHQMVVWAATRGARVRLTFEL